MKYAALAVATMALAGCGASDQTPTTSVPTDSPRAAPLQPSTTAPAGATREERVEACVETMTANGAIRPADARQLCEDAAAPR